MHTYIYVFVRAGASLLLLQPLLLLVMLLLLHAAVGCTRHTRDLYQIMILTGTTRAASSNSSIRSRHSRSMVCILVRCRWGLRGAAVHNTRERARTLHREFEYSSQQSAAMDTPCSQYNCQCAHGHWMQKLSFYSVLSRAANNIYAYIYLGGLGGIARNERQRQRYCCVCLIAQHKSGAHDFCVAVHVFSNPKQCRQKKCVCTMRLSCEHDMFGGFCLNFRDATGSDKTLARFKSAIK